MKRVRKEEDRVLLSSKFSSSAEPPPKVRKWLKISMILSAIMGTAFAVAFVRNYYVSDSFTRNEDEPFPALVFLAPFLIQATYYSTKKHLEANWYRMGEPSSFSGASDYDTFVVLITKLFLAMAFVCLCAEIVGHKVWYNWMKLCWVTLLHFAHALTGR